MKVANPRYGAARTTVDLGIAIEASPQVIFRTHARVEE
jgi:hypothetical protein